MTYNVFSGTLNPTHFTSCFFCFCCVRFSCFCTKTNDWPGRTPLKWSVLCQAGHTFWCWCHPKMHLLHTVSVPNSAATCWLPLPLIHLWLLTGYIRLCYQLCVGSVWPWSISANCDQRIAWMGRSSARSVDLKCLLQQRRYFITIVAMLVRHATTFSYL